MDGLQANSLKKVSNVEWPQGKRAARRLVGGGVDKEMQMEGRGNEMANEEFRRRKCKDKVHFSSKWPTGALPLVT